jgi:hypothetical protein
MMFDKMSLDTRSKSVLLCCAGVHCHGDDLSSKVFSQYLLGKPVENKIVLRMRLGNDEAYVKNTEIPRNNEAHWRVLEESGNS